MAIDFKRLEASLCNQLCEKIVFHTRDDGVTMLESPLAFPDGDQYPILEVNSEVRHSTLTVGG